MKECMGAPREKAGEVFTLLLAMKSWAGPGNEASIH